jgi:hypothetical protein
MPGLKICQPRVAAFEISQADSGTFAAKCNAPNKSARRKKSSDKWRSLDMQQVQEKSTRALACRCLNWCLRNGDIPFLLRLHVLL